MGNPKRTRPLFVAPIDLQADDEITLLLGNPICIRRNGVEIWRDPHIPEALFDAIMNQEFDLSTGYRCYCSVDELLKKPSTDSDRDSALPS